MDKAKLYNRANNLQRRDAKRVLDEFGQFLQFSASDVDQSLLDIGCGSGDVLVDYVLPFLSEGNVKRIIGSDISEEMVRFARDQYKGKSNLHFDQLDIGTANIDPFLERYSQFDHITSFYCLHWVQEQETALRNIASLLKNDGDCLLVFIAQMPIFDIYERMAATKKWHKYMEDVDKFVSPYQHSLDPGNEFGKLMETVGFTDFHVEVKDEAFYYDGYQNLKRAVRAVNPFMKRMPENLQEEFLADYVRLVKVLNLVEIHGELDEDVKILTKYKLIIAYGKK